MDGSNGVRAVTVDQQTLEYVFDRTDGGYVVVGERDGTSEQYSISGVTEDLQREWHVEFEADGNAPKPITGIQPTSGTFLLGGGVNRESDPSGLALLVTAPDTQPPTATPTPSPTPSPTTTPSPTPSTATDGTETTSRATETELPAPGVPSAMAAVAGLGTWLASRWQREE